MKYRLVLSGRFKKSLKLARKRGLNINLLDAVVEKLLYGIPLEEKNKEHALSGNYKGFREGHIQPDWLVKGEYISEIYKWYNEGLFIVNRKYQRKLVWSLQEKQKFIDTIIKNYPSLIFTC